MPNILTSAPFVLRNVKTKERARLIANAKSRVLIYAPGLSAPEIAALQEARQQIPSKNILVYLDVSANSFLAGYWHGQSAEALDSMIGMLSVYNASQVRLGLLVVDDLALIYTPPLPRVEVEQDGAEANAVQLNAEMTELLWRSILILPVGSEGEPSVMAGANGHPPTEFIPIPERPLVDQKALEPIIAQQKYIPPCQPEKERLLISLRNRIKLVRLQVEGHKIQQRTLLLPDEIVEILGSDSQQINEYLRASWRIFTEHADKEIQELQLRLNQQVERIRKTYLKPLGHFGGGLLTKQLPDFEGELKILQSTLDEIKSYIHEKVPAYLTDSREQLIRLILERAKARGIVLPQPQLDLFPIGYQGDQHRRAAERLVEKVDWPTEDELAGKVQLHLSIDDMTMNHLSQPDFIKVMEKAYQIDLAKLMGDLDRSSDQP